MTAATNARQEQTFGPSVLGVRQDQLNTDRLTGKPTRNGGLEVARHEPCQVRMVARVGLDRRASVGPQLNSTPQVGDKARWV